MTWWIVLILVFVSIYAVLLISYLLYSFFTYIYCKFFPSKYIYKIQNNWTTYKLLCRTIVFENLDSLETKKYSKTMYKIFWYIGKIFSSHTLKLNTTKLSSTEIELLDSLRKEERDYIHAFGILMSFRGSSETLY